jgi:hypothetical protein
VEKLKDKRKHKRSLCNLKVIKEDTGEHIGHVGDIHHEGLILISENEIPLNDDLSICVETLEEEINISLVVKGVWNKMNDESKCYETGCQIINPSSETINAIYNANSILMDNAMVLLKALEEYGEHKSGCSHGETACDCGLDKVIYSYNRNIPNLRKNTE